MLTYENTDINHQQQIIKHRYQPHFSIHQIKYSQKPQLWTKFSHLVKSTNQCSKRSHKPFSPQNPNSTNQNHLISHTITYKARNFTLKPINYTNKNQIQLTINQNYTKFTSKTEINTKTHDSPREEEPKGFLNGELTKSSLVLFIPTKTHTDTLNLHKKHTHINT